MPPSSWRMLGPERMRRGAQGPRSGGRAECGRAAHHRITAPRGDRRRARGGLRRAARATASALRTAASTASSLTERSEHLDQLTPERGRVPGGEPHGLGVQQLAQNRVHEIGRGQGAAIPRVHQSPRRSTRSALAWPRGSASICLESLWIWPLPKAQAAGSRPAGITEIIGDSAGRCSGLTSSDTARTQDHRPSRDQQRRRRRRVRRRSMLQGLQDR